MIEEKSVLNLRICKSQKLCGYFKMEGTGTTSTLTFIEDGVQNKTVVMDFEEMVDLYEVVESYMTKVYKFKEMFSK